MVNNYINIFTTIVLDSLKNNKGKYSSKKLQTFVSFNLCIFLIIVDHFTRFKINFDVFLILISFAGLQTGLSMISSREKK